MSRSSCAFAAIATFLAIAVVACDGSDSAPAPGQTAATDDGGPNGQRRPITVRCEGITPKPGWRRKTTSVGSFGLFVKHLASQATELSNGNHLVKAGAAVVGDQPVTLRVPDALTGAIGLVYGDESRGRGRRPATAPRAVTFEPCEDKQRSGYVGGLIFRGETHAITLEVLSHGSVQHLELMR
jgi:hypothetical protein